MNFPIDVTPYVMVYAAVVFLCPWLILASYLLRELRVLRKHGLLGLTTNAEVWNEIQSFRKTNPESKYLYGKVKQWMKITLTFWVTGFVILCAALYLLDANDLLINHSKGIYGRDECK
ncbi:MAG: hypothetical protein ACE5IQ_02645 [Candidatus Methylomirabilales bacterium]